MLGCGLGANPPETETSCLAPHSGQNMLSVGIWAPQELQFMVLPFQRLLMPPFLKGCDEIPILDSIMRAFPQHHNPPKPYLHGVKKVPLVWGGDTWLY